MTSSGKKRDALLKSLTGKLPNLLELKYQSVGDAMAELGSVAEISEVFIGFQGYLYLQKDTE